MTFSQFCLLLPSPYQQLCTSLQGSDVYCDFVLMTNFVAACAAYCAVVLLFVIALKGKQ